MICRQREYEIKTLIKNKEPLESNDYLLYLQCFIHTQMIYHLKINDHFYQHDVQVTLDENQHIANDG